MEWDWTTFLPTLLATFAGVLVSVALSLGAYRLRNWRREKTQSKETREALLIELEANERTLETVKQSLGQAEGLPDYKVYFRIPWRLGTVAYDVAFQGGTIRLVGDAQLQRDLRRVVEHSKYLNAYLQRAEDFATQNWLLQQSFEDDFKVNAVRSSIAHFLTVAAESAENCLSKTIEVRQKLEAIK